ncbi:MAG: dihydrodipicolinate synthase family protein, partial [Clostridia bacterium]
TKTIDLPFFIYNIPALSGYNLSNKLFSKMVQNEKIVGIKSSSEVAHDIIRFKMNVPDDFIVYSGCDEHYLAGRVVGADGGIGGTYAVFYELFFAIEKAFLNGDITKATALQKKATALIYRLVSFPSMMGSIKAMLKLDGIDIGEPRLPFLPVSEKDSDLIALYNDTKHAMD